MVYHFRAPLPDTPFDPAIDDALLAIQRRRLLAGASGLLLGAAAGCAGPAVATPTRAPTTRTVKHVMGETAIPLAPARVVTLDTQSLMLPLFELGFTGVAGSTGTTEGGRTFFPRMQRYDTTSIEFLGAGGAPSLEKIVALKPDLILGSEYSNKELYPQFGQIAPTIYLQTHTRPIKEHVAELAGLVGRGDAAKELEAKYQARLAELRKALGDPARYDLSLIAFQSESSYILDAFGATTTAFSDAGFTLPTLWREAIEVRKSPTLSLETLPQVDGDVIFARFWSQATGNAMVPAAVTSSALWQGLNAVRKGQVYPIDIEQWYGNAYQPLMNILDSFFERLVTRAVDASWTATGR
jgi:iron complex transport system substrate-binding protein